MTDFQVFQEWHTYALLIIFGKYIQDSSDILLMDLQQLFLVYNLMFIQLACTIKCFLGTRVFESS